MVVNPYTHAEQLYRKQHFSRSAFFFEKAYLKDTSNKHAAARAAQAHKRAMKFSESRGWFQKLENERHEEILYGNEYVYDYFDLLKMLNDTSRLAYLKEKIAKNELSPATVKVFLDLVLPKRNFYLDSATSSLQKLPMNSDFDEICPLIQGNYLYFLSNRPRPSLLSNDIDSSGFFKYFMVPLSKNMASSADEWKEFGKIRHEGPITVFNNGTRAILSQNASKAGERKLALFIFEKTSNGTWTNRGKLNFCVSGKSYSHPFFHESSKTLYFVVSDGNENTDIFTSTLRDNAFEEPVALPSAINSPKNELFPYVTKDNKLYFSSNGHSGLGGYDLFVVQLDSLTTDPINLGYPINSTRDDLSLTLLPNGKEGFLASNREEGTRDDIYRFKFHQIKYVLAVKDKMKGTPIKNGTLKVIDFKTDEVLYNKNLGVKNELVFKPGRKYMIEVHAQNFRTESYPVMFMQKNDTTINKNLFLEKINKSFVKGKVLKAGGAVAECRVKILDIMADSVEQTVTKTDGSFVCEINRDTVTYFFVSDGKDSCMFRYEPLKKFKRGSGVTFIDVNLVKMKTKSYDFSIVDSSNVAEKDSIWLRNDLSRNQLLLYPNNFPLNRLVFWDNGHFSFVIKNEDGGFEPVKTFTTSDRLKKITLVYDREKKYKVKPE